MELDLECGKCGKRLKDKIYRACKRNAELDFMLYCEECANKVDSKGLDACEAKEVETLLSDLAIDFDKLIQMCPRCEKENKQTPVSHEFTDEDDDESKKRYCEQHGKEVEKEKNGELRELDEDERYVNVRKISLLTHQANPRISKGSIDVIQLKDLKGLIINPERLKVPAIADKKNGPAILFKGVLDEAVSWFKANFDPKHVTLTNAFHFWTLSTAIFQLNALIHHPQKGYVLKDYGTTSGAEFSVEPTLFKVDEECDVTIQTLSDPNECEPYFKAPGLIVTILKVERKHEMLKVTFKLEMNKMTSPSAKLGVFKTRIRVGYTKGEDEYSKAATVTTDPLSEL